MRPPAGACDSHSHVFGPAKRFPYAPTRTYEPAETPIERYRILAEALGLSRAVFVQPAAYARDHNALIDALARGRGRYRGVGLVDDSIGDAELGRLHAAGLRGARFNFVGHLGGAPSPELLARTAERVAPLGWHVAVHVDEAALLAWADRFVALPCPLVIDHMARMGADRGLEQPGPRALLALAGEPGCWVKISGADRMVAGPEDLKRALPLMQAIIEAAPDRTLWGVDWPHPNSRWMPDDGDLADLLAEAAPDPAAQRAILASNPERLYCFPPEENNA